MDEGLLNDLLECSVCLERLDTSSRVLPCQHTFCLKCLKVIVESHKELRCPECRILVEAKVEELPPNVLLMRILEGMRNNVPRKLMPAQRTNRHAQGGAGAAAGRDKPLPPHGRALYDFISKEPGDLSFKKGDTVLLQKRLDAFWYQGESGGRAGLFPITYLQVVVPLPAPTALCKALYDFRMSAPDEEGCLAFDKGAIITVHRRVDENWAEGRLEQRVGIFPIAFVELNQPARLLINSAPLNRPAPPAPPALAQHAAHAQHSHRYQPMSLSTPAGGTYASPGAGHMSQSQPAYHAQPQSLPGPGSPRAILEPHTKHAPDLIHFGVHGHPGGGGVLQSVSRADDRLRLKCEYAPDTYANVRADHLPPPSSDSSSGAATSASSAGTPPTSGASDDSAEPSLPSSPDEPRLDASMGVLSLNESSTATNTALNVSLPPAESPRPDGPAASSSKPDRPSGPDSLLTFGLGLQAALSPVHGKDGYAARTHRDHHHREKRHSLTPSSHLQPNHSTQNRHSAEILATSLLDGCAGVGTDTEARRRRSRSGERALPALYVALYPYRPQKPDELDLKKGAMYVVTERCRDGWYKGRSERSQRAGVFPGNYVARAKHDKQQAPARTAVTTVAGPAPAVAAAGTGAGPAGTPAPPDAPPRAHSPAAGQPLAYPWSSGIQSQTQQNTPRSDKSKDKKSEKSISTGVSLMKRLAAMKKCKSPPPAAGYSLDNPVFDDSCSTARLQPQHVRSGSCPSQLLRALPGAASPAGAERRHKERLLHDHRRVTGEGPWQSQHRKSQSLDVTATRRERHHAQPVKERFRCVVPYPPNSEYELELQLDDIVLVSRKRGDGWYKGTLQRTGRSGLFPASFVQPAPP